MTVKVECLWPGETFAILASGPSMTREDAEFCRGKARVICINTTYQLAPLADVLFAADLSWWRWAKGAPDFHGLKYSVATKAEFKDVQLLHRSDGGGLDRRPTHLRLGNLPGLRSANSGYQAINLAVHLGAKRIVLLGYDMQRTKQGKNWHPSETRRMSPYRDFQRAYPTLVQPLRQLGIEIVNCSRATALGCFPRVPLDQVLPAAVAA